MYEEKEEMITENESVDVTDLEEIDDYDVDEGEDTEGLDLSKVLKGFLVVLGITGIAAYAKRDKIREWKEKRDMKKLKKLAKKYGMTVSELETAIEARFEEVESDEDCIVFEED